MVIGKYRVIFILEIVIAKFFPIYLLVYGSYGSNINPRSITSYIYLCVYTYMYLCVCICI